MRRVLLIGINGVYNYGCEAIVRGTEAILREKWPEIEIVYATPRVEDDRKRLKGCNLVYLPRTFKKYSASNIARKLVALVGGSWQPVWDNLSHLEEVDAVFSIGGDIFTLRTDGSYNASLAKFGEVAEKRGIPYLLWGASVGPFTANPKAESFFRQHLAKITHIVAREQDTLDYLARIGVAKNVSLCPDPAFSVAPALVSKQKPKGEKLRIAINLSPLSVSYSGLTSGAAISQQSQIIGHIVSRHKAEVVLVPHVLSTVKESDDDLRYLRKVWQALDLSTRSSVRILDTDPGFIGVKGVLVECDLVIAARMHCAINALASHVPTIFIAYSQKAKGMAEYIYGDRSLVVDLKDFTTDGALPMIDKAIAERHIIKNSLVTRIHMIRNQPKIPAALTQL